jgi:AcrR family transcriptional regulator
VAERGFHGAAMAAIAAEAGVAAGTAYVHYDGKDELLIAAYLEVKRELGVAATARVDIGARPADRFAAAWDGALAFLRADRDRARFLVQFEAGPLAHLGQNRALAEPDDPLIALIAAPDVAALLVPLPPLVVYDLALGPLVRAVAGGADLDDGQLDDAGWLALRAACWRAIAPTVPA